MSIGLSSGEYDGKGCAVRRSQWARISYGVGVINDISHLLVYRLSAALRDMHLSHAIAFACRDRLNSFYS